MRKLPGLMLVCAAAVALIAGCARGPSVPVPPSVRVSQFGSTLFTPRYVRFVGKVFITNNMRQPIDFAKVDYGMSLFEKSIESGSFAGMKRIGRNGTETVTLPMRISMKKILAQHIAILANGKMRFSFHGSVYPSPSSGFSPIPFSASIEIPLPNIPTVTFVSTSGIPLTRSFRVQIGVDNTNRFPLQIDRVDTYLDLNGQRYTMLRTNHESEIGAGQIGTLALSMHASKTAALSMALNALENNAVHFKVGGSVTAETPFGEVFIPVQISAKSRPKS